ncbi:hypothetical protein MNBD_GAMMA13-752 [hydrothermal vent metagenome]|uniref:Uncharacterized protein n=1 Tax=hydrothermal vent metagenome TaxID=652676 RepID=A0A3B0YBJ9_9ZZZZ
MESKVKLAYKPGSVEDSHSSGTPVAERLKRPTREQRGPRQCSPIWSCSGWGLPCHRCCQRRGALLPHHFTLTGAYALRRYIFCGTFRRLSPPRRYLAPCPMEPGLSSMTEITAAARPASSDIIRVLQRDDNRNESCTGISSQVAAKSERLMALNQAY